jgi:hypothetical protein
MVCNNDFYDNQTMCKPKIMLCKPKSVMCKLFPSICKPRNLGNSEEFLQGSLCPHLNFTGLIRSPHSWFNQWMSLFRVKIKFTWFAPVYTPMPPDGQKHNRKICRPSSGLQRLQRESCGIPCRVPPSSPWWMDVLNSKFPT